jgi:hypothetical protein
MKENNFALQLTAGIYNMTTRIPGFYPFHRARFKVIGGTTVMINVIRTPRSSMPGTTVSFKESAAKLIPFPKFGQVRVFAKSALTCESRKSWRRYFRAAS